MIVRLDNHFFLLFFYLDTQLSEAYNIDDYRYSSLSIYGGSYMQTKIALMFKALSDPNRLKIPKSTFFWSNVWDAH